MEGQLRKLRNGTHPKTGRALPVAVALDHEATKERSEANKEMPKGFYRYSVAADPPPVPTEPGITAKKREDLHTRIKNKELANKTIADAKVVRNSAACKGKYRIITKGAACHGRACCEVILSGGETTGL